MRDDNASVAHHFTRECHFQFRYRATVATFCCLVCVCDCVYWQIENEMKWNAFARIVQQSSVDMERLFGVRHRKSRKYHSVSSGSGSGSAAAAAVHIHLCYHLQKLFIPLAIFHILPRPNGTYSECVRDILCNIFLFMFCDSSMKFGKYL